MTQEEQIEAAFAKASDCLPDIKFEGILAFAFRLGFIAGQSAPKLEEEKSCCGGCCKD